MNDEICPVCAEGTLTECTEETTFKDDVKVDLVFSICDTCGSEISDADQVSRNRKAYIIAKGMYE